jgi:hypothetical protein
MTNKEDTEWKDSGHGYMIRSTKMPLFKPFKLEEALKDTWCISAPDDKGYVIHCGGHFVDGKMVEEWRKAVPDPLHKITRP